MSTLEELQERYPHGSRWEQHATWQGKLEHRVYRVIGPDAGGVVTGLTTNGQHEGYTLWNADRLDLECTRIPDPPPSPITEPVTLYARRSDDQTRTRYWTESNDTSWLGTLMSDSITVLPEGQEPPDEAVHSGWWWS